MAIQFSCVKCGVRIEVNDQYAGGQCECPSCNATLVVPLESATPPAAAAQPAAGPGMPPPVPRMSPPTVGQILPPADTGRKGWATAALVTGILSFCMPPLGLIAITCGVVALVKVSNRPSEYGGKGLAIAGITTGGIGLVLIFFWAVVVAIMLPSLARARELSKRSVCQANLKGIGTACYTYANENQDFWPMPMPPDLKKGEPTLVDYTAAIGSYRGKASNPTAGDVTAMQTIPAKLSTTRSGWMLVRLMMSPPASFCCPDSGDTPNAYFSPQDHWDFGVGDITGPATAAQAREGWRHVSYGFQVSFGRYGKPSSDRDQRMVLMADKGPFGAALDAGLAAPPPIAADETSTPDQWRRWNSPNHGGQGRGEGQNALYADSHADWQNKPVCGVGDDNIYTQWAGKGATARDRAQGNPPTAGGKQVPASNTDTLIYP
jgi:hypothetical protein